jgi:hypothetical protein
MSVVTSTFDGSENPLSEGGTWATPTGATAMQKISGAARGTASGLVNMARLATPTIGAAQFSEIEVEDDNPAYPAACVRMQAGSTNCYALELNDDGQGVVQINRFEAGPAQVTLGENIRTPMEAKNKFRLFVEGTTLLAYKNGVLLATRTDSTYATGQPGIRCENSDSVNGMLSWSGGDGGKIVPAPAPDYRQFPKVRMRA